MLNELRDFFSSLITNPGLYSIIKGIIVFVAGMLILKVIVYLFSKRLFSKYSPQSEHVMKKLIFYTGIIIVMLFSMQVMGIKMSAILGAAGIAGIAIGFAAQTSVSNIISGFFLLSEKPFEINDLIKVDGQLGIVLSIDLLSVKLRTLDNLFIRIPNETILKTNVLNITKFPIRRMNFDLSVAYKEDLEKVRNTLFDIAAQNPYCLDQPEPYFLIRDFKDSGISILFGAWFDKNDYTELKNTMMTEILERFKRENIEIPFPHISVYTGSATQPFPFVEIPKKTD